MKPRPYSKELEGAEPIRFNTTKYGFEYGAAEVTRIHSDEKQGWVIMAVKSPKAELQIYVTKTGKIRVWNYKTGDEFRPAHTAEIKRLKDE